MWAHSARRLSIILLLALLLGGLPTASLRAQGGPPPEDPPADPPVEITVPEMVDPHLPSLSLHLAVANPIPIIIFSLDPLQFKGSPFFTLTVVNDAPDPANNLVVTLPTPPGTTAVAGPNTLGPTLGWQWTIPQLAGQTSIELSGDMRLTAWPTGNALLMHAQATADGLDRPIHEDGGAVVILDREASVIPVTEQPTADYTPGAPAQLSSSLDGIYVTAPADAAAVPLQLSYSRWPPPDAPMPPVVSNRTNGFGTFFLDAIDSESQAIHQFNAPLTIAISYTPEQLQALGIAEDDLTLFWYDPTLPITLTDDTVALGAWQTVPTQVDPYAHTVTALVDHFSAFQLSDGSSPSAAFIPSLQGFQVSSFTGAASYSYPIDVPAGPGGLKPNLSLSYSSASADGEGGKRVKQQAGWAGLGWSLDTGSVAANKMPNGQVYYTIVFDGQSYDLMRGAALVGSPNVSNPTHWDWRPTDESFVRVRVIDNGVSTSTRGGFHFGLAYPRYTWQLWTKSGIRYDFSEDMWWGWNYCGGTGDYAYMETARWLLSSVTDPHGNTITYIYGRDSQTKSETCFHVQGTVDRDAWPLYISWAGGRYQVNLISSARAADTQFDGADNQYGGINGQPRQTRQLNAIQVWSNPAGTWQLVRQYNLGYDYSLRSDALIGTGCAPGQVKCPDNNYPKLTLKRIQRIGNNSTSALPATTFSYGAFSAPLVNGRYWAGGSWNRLTTINNGQGGTVTLAYANAGQVANSTLMDNQRRVTTRTMTDGRGNSYSWNYGYGTPNVNTLGTVRGPQSPWHYGEYGTQAYPNSAALYYNAFNDVLHDSQNWLAHKPMREFRGHDWVQETDPSGARVTHFFYQGAATDQCTPTVTGGAIGADACFQRLRDGEFLKGKEYRTQMLPASGSALLQETVNSFAVQFLDYTTTPLSGLWRAFTSTYQTDHKQYEGGATPLSSSTRYCYDTAQQAGVQYGNLTHTRIYDQLITTAQNVVADCDLVGSAPLPVRIERQDYIILNTAGSYIVDRVAQAISFDSQSRLLGLTETFYDGTTTYKGIGTHGDLTLTRAYYDVPLATSSTGITLHSQDTSSGYDTYGNQTTATTYAGAGTRLYNGSTVTYSAPGAGSAARTTTTTYDGVFHAFPTQVSNPLGQIQRADYDERMGTLVRATGPNTTGTPTNCSQTNYAIPSTNTYTIPAAEESTCAQYDVFGRMVKLVKPGDSTTYPTLQAWYYDSEQPFRYRVDRREAVNTATVRVGQQFYDGMGRQIQTKQEGPLGWQNIIVDTRYDGLGQVTATSQARYVTQDATTFVQYTNPGSGALYNRTATTYDALGRPVRTTMPDNTWVEHAYGLFAGLAFHDVVDSNRHRVQTRNDVLGRLREVQEISGDCGTSSYSWASCAAPYTTTWAVYATTTYSYDALDRMTQVTDALGNVTKLTYDSLDRKTQLDDPDLGIWDYTYDANGNLVTQTDNQAPRQTLWFGYDALGRQTQRRQTNASGTLLAQYIYDQTSATNKGIGQRTAMSVPSGASSSWEYDARGRKTEATHTIPVGATNYTRVFGWAYDSADRISSVTYPTVGGTTEVVSYVYDAAWRPRSACTSRGGCYVSSATYTALDQPDQWTFGNTLVQDWVYSSPTQRMQQLLVGANGSVFNRSYTYDNGGNVQTILDSKLNPNQTQNFDYDHRDRLTQAWTTGNSTNAYNESYTYNAIGNLLSKTGVGSYTYPASGSTSTRPHTPSAVNGGAYTYNGNGNLTGGGGRTYTWNTDNHVASVSQTSGSESYSYDADGERVKKVRGSVTTLYDEGLWEETAGGATRIYYTFNNEVVAVRDSATNVVTYLHTDHIGTISLATSSAGVGSVQHYYPWGTQRGGDTITQTSLDFTGQRRDDTGLLYYHARFYDPLLGRFLSSDSKSPNLNNPQDLNHYSYVLNNPVRFNDPSGRCIPFIGDCRPIWETGGGLNVHDFQQYSAGVVEGMGSLGAAVASLAMPETWQAAGQALEGAIADPKGTALAMADAAVDQGKAIVANAQEVISDPMAAAAALNDNPRQLGRMLGQAAGDLVLAKVAKDIKGEGSGGSCSTNSFSANTPVATADGPVPIADIDIGDHVLAWDEATNSTGSYTVTATINHIDPVVVDLTLGGEQLETTAQHPFYTQEQGWVDAGKLWLGAHVRTADGGTGMVQGVVVAARPQGMYNLTVAVAHTFFVGEEGWLVHNTPCRFVNGVSIEDRAGNVVAEGTTDLKPTLDRIDSGGSYPHVRDGTTFGNREGLLPTQPRGYYTEYVHPTPGLNGPGPQRIVTGGAGEIYYTPDHYRSFIKVQ
ncbi:MAG: polymorphic toxin-type HINT domain-containing protein [Roseiflexaceae bacterium]